MISKIYENRDNTLVADISQKYGVLYGIAKKTTNVLNWSGHLSIEEFEDFIKKNDYKFKEIEI